MKIDLHCHSCYSSRPSDWILKKIGTAESYTSPINLYKILKNAGMDAVTITDHNTITGCLELKQQFKDVFISCEYTTYLPDKCKFHVLCWNITEEQHNQISKIRENIYEFISYLKQNNIAHGLAHPLFSINGKLTINNFQEVIQLFDTFEMNSAKDAFSNQYLEVILAKAKDNYILTAGSDDHSGLTLGRGHTITDATNIDDFFVQLKKGNNSISCKGSTPHTLARHIYSIALQWLQNSGKIENYPKVLESYLLPAITSNKDRGMKGWFKKGHPKFWSKNLFFKYLSSKIQDLDSEISGCYTPAERFFKLLEEATNKYLVHLGNTIITDAMNHRMVEVFKNIGISFFLYVILTPYLVGFSIFGAQRKLSRQILKKYVPDNLTPIRIAKFTDNFGKVDGVSKTLEEQVVEAHRSGKDYTIVTCTGKHLSNTPGVKYFEPVGMFTAPEYSDQPLCWPPILKIIDYCYNEQFTHIQTATPGPMGLLAMLVAHTLGLPLHSTYHTQIPQFIGEVTEEGVLEELAWYYITWFYDQASIIFVPSEHTKQELIEHHIDSNKIKVYPRGVDTVRFHPGKRNRKWLKEVYGVSESDKVFLYVGRVSKEKNLKVTIDAYKELLDELPSGHTLIIVGNGDYLEDLRALSKELPVIFTDILEGEDLAMMFASADVFVFSSERDTHGRVILEALSSGVPCVVSNIGGPHENIINGKTGIIIYDMNKSNLKDAMIKMYDKDLEEMSVEARKYIEASFSFTQAFNTYWNMYE